VLKVLVMRSLERLGFKVSRAAKDPQVHLLGLTKRPIRTILDIGASDGVSAKRYRNVFPHATIYCFEPLPCAYEALVEWTKTQEGKVIAFNMALGSAKGKATIHYHTDHSPSSSLLITTATNLGLYPKMKRQQQEEIRIDRLDNIAASLDLTSELLVKMDVQGFEGEVIRGGKTVLQQAIACILEIALMPLYEDQASFNELHHLLSDIGFTYAGNLHQVYDDNGRVIYIDAVYTNDYLMRLVSRTGGDVG
jgi:FkbM family methyltransferase